MIPFTSQGAYKASARWLVWLACLVFVLVLGMVLGLDLVLGLVLVGFGFVFGLFLVCFWFGCFLV